jgi:hypothetical protein
VIVAAVAAFRLGMGSAYAAGAPREFQPPVYGSQAFSDHTNAAQSRFLGHGTVGGNVFRKNSGDSNNNQVAADPRT